MQRDSSGKVAYRNSLDVLSFIDYIATKALSTSNHVFGIAIDFEKPLDRIGAHTNQLIKWKLGKKIISYINSFLGNKKLRVLLNGYYLNSYSLQNGIPQGSPLPVVLFQIAFEKLNKNLLYFNIDNLNIVYT